MLSGNSNCWCGSGQKYKNCHRAADSEKTPSIQEILNKRSETFEKKLCCHPLASKSTCNQVIKAHTIQRKGNLELIAESGHVLKFLPNFAKLSTSSQFPLELEKIGIKKASTFNGFCGFHDDTTFAEIEKNGLGQVDKRKALLLAYRAICHENYLKNAAVDFQIIAFRAAMSRRGQSNFPLEEFNKSLKLGLSDVRKEKKKYDGWIKSGKSDHIRFYAVTFTNAPDIMSVGATQVTSDFHGTLLQNISDETLKLSSIKFSLIAAGGKGIAIFVWEDGNQAAEKLIASLEQIPHSQLPEAIVRFAFANFENTYMRSSWWDSQSAATQTLIKSLVLEYIQLDTLPDLKSYIPDGSLSINLTVDNIFSG